MYRFRNIFGELHSGRGETDSVVLRLHRTNGNERSAAAVLNFEGVPSEEAANTTVHVGKVDRFLQKIISINFIEKKIAREHEPGKETGPAERGPLRTISMSNK